jgi:hypothetical protein
LLFRNPDVYPVLASRRYCTSLRGCGTKVGLLVCTSLPTANQYSCTRKSGFIIVIPREKWFLLLLLREKDIVPAYVGKPVRACTRVREHGTHACEVVLSSTRAREKDTVPACVRTAVRVWYSCTWIYFIIIMPWFVLLLLLCYPHQQQHETSKITLKGLGKFYLPEYPDSTNDPMSKYVVLIETDLMIFQKFWISR